MSPHSVSPLSYTPTISRMTLNNSNAIQPTMMSTTLRQQQHHHHHTNSRSQTQLTLQKLSNLIPPSSTNLQINLIEPILYFRGNTQESVGCFLRGHLILNLPKPTKIRKIEMKFVGRMKTFWPEGKLYYGSTSNRNNLCEEREIMSHNWTFLSPSPSTPSSETLPPSPPLNSDSNRFRILRRSSSSLTSSKPHLILAGVHKYPFELFIPGNIPETIDTERGTVNYKLSATAVRSGLSSNLHVSQNVTIIRTFLEERNSEGTAIANEWNNQLGYEITIPKKAYPIGDSIEIDLKLSPRAKKTKITGIKIQIEEEAVYKTNGQKYLESRTLSIHKVNNFVEQRTMSGKNDSINYNDTIQEGTSSSVFNTEDEGGNSLGNLFYHQNISLPIPKCTNPIYFSYKSSSINISHYLKFIFTMKSPLNNSDDYEDDKKMKKKTDVKVDVPITILSCRCADDLPQYEDESYNLHRYSDDSPSYESPPSYEQSTDNRPDYLRRQTVQQYSILNSEIRDNSTNTFATIASQLRHPQLERLLTV
ncbi:S-antigen, C-terminal domain-containing protein [Glomus cerebriforme]|uniref:S-antigen, C-terminal domain-containing protein n=1 Tax=Glomus cerebriforme TaxID=658196 RepID=A0A397T0M6_9GLOM|nr:S-antigen, C-terminal domain-containing protein [Glomus cerebriforme]